jgi:diphosphomevalonate decarboxylase
MSDDRLIRSASAIAHPNIALIKYWGDRDPHLHLPANGSISMNLDGLFTRTQVTFDSGLPSDRVTINGDAVGGQALSRVSSFLSVVRRKAEVNCFAEVISENNFPAGAGIASSASAFAALGLGAASAAGLDLDEAQLSRLARQGSGSACRSVPGGFVEWIPGTGDEDSYARSITPLAHWDLVDCIAIVSQQHKQIGSWEGHTLAETSPIQAARIADAPRRLSLCRKAILEKDFEALAEICELDCNLMHAVMITSTPRLIYWLPATLTIIQTVQDWRAAGFPVFYTIDAGPNVHVFSLQEHASQLEEQLGQLPGVERVIPAYPGGAARLELR